MTTNKEFEQNDLNFIKKSARITGALALIFSVCLQLSSNESDCEVPVKVGNKFAACDVDGDVQVMTDFGQKKFGDSVVCDMDKVTLKEDRAVLKTESVDVVTETYVSQDLSITKFTLSTYPEPGPGDNADNC